MVRRGAGFVIASALTLALAPAAGAEDRFASPSGSGVACTAPSPCDIDEAVEGPGADSGDVVKLLPGTYTPATTTGSPDRALVITDALTIEPMDPATRPTISAGSGITAVISFAAGVTIRGLNITAVNPPAAALNLQQATVAERLHVSVSGTTGQTAVSIRNGATLRDSVAWAPASGVAVSTGGSGATLDNVTASGGFRGIAIDSNFGTPQSVAVTNTIALGGVSGDDIFIRQATGTSVMASITNSNYDDLVNSSADVTETAIQTTLPALLTPGLGNFHQLEASPTINAGVVQASTASRRDLDGDPRWLGAAPDIGADERPEAPPPGSDPPAVDPPGSGPAAVPQTTITKQPKRKLRSKRKRARVRIAFVSSVPGSSFECSLDRKPFRPCTSPFKKKVKPGRHRFQVQAVSPSGVRDQTPAAARWKLKRRR